MGIKIELKAGSFSGHVFPVDLDVAYDVDRANSPASLEVGLYTFFDEEVVSLVPGSLDPAGSYVPGTGLIAWEHQTLKPGAGWQKFGASFQWMNFRAAETAFNGAVNAGSLGLHSAGALVVSRPSISRGLKLKE